MGCEGGRGGVGLGERVPVTPCPKNPKVKFIKNEQKNQLKKKYVEYLFNNTF